MTKTSNNQIKTISQPNIVHQPIIGAKPTVFIDPPKPVRSNKRRHVDKVPLSPQLELQRFRRQFVCECISLTIITLAVIFVTLTPFLLIPIWVVPNDYSLAIRDFLWVALVLTIVFLILGATLGNVYWYFDPKKRSWRWFFHCGRGPISYYWGDIIFGSDKDHLRQEEARQARQQEVFAV